MPLPCGSCTFQSASSPARSRSRGSRTAPECGRHIVGTYTHRPSPLSLFCLFFQILFDSTRSVIQTRTSIKALKRLFLDLRRHSIDFLQPRLTLVFPCDEKLPPSVLNFTVLYYRARDTHDGQWCVQ